MANIESVAGGRRNVHTSPQLEDSSEVGWLSAAACISVILLAPIPTFLVHHGSSILSFDGLVLVGLLGGVALLLTALPLARRPLVLSGFYALAILVFVDFHLSPKVHEVVFVSAACVLWAVLFATRQGATKILGVLFGLMFLISCLSRPPAEVALLPGDEDLPAVIHLVLDEHVGLQGISDPELEQELVDLYVSRGFRIHQRAFSLFDTTIKSLLSAFEGGDLDLSEFSEREGVDSLGESAQRLDLFESHSARGYKINVYQSSWLDFCDQLIAADTCHSYAVWRLKEATQHLSRFSAERAGTVLSLVARRSQFATSLRWRYRAFRAWTGLPLPSWAWEVARPTGPFLAEELLQKISSHAESSRRGQVFFAHLIHPHFPYVYDRNCEIKPSERWTAAPGWPAGVIKPVPEARVDYLDQLRCANLQVAELLDLLAQFDEFDDATILIHGDHGSRLEVTDPMPAEGPELDRRLVDRFSTLLAVKRPGIDPGVEMKPISINESIAKLWSLPIPREQVLRSRGSEPLEPLELPVPAMWRSSETPSLVN